MSKLIKNSGDSLRNRWKKLGVCNGMKVILLIEYKQFLARAISITYMLAGLSNTVNLNL